MDRFLCAAALLLGVACRAFSLEAGAAKTEITPPLNTPLNGYGDRLGRSAMSVHDPLWARCLYLNDGATSILLVNVDLCVINRELRDRVFELAPTEVPRENVFLTATHTHSAQGGMSQSLIARAVSGPFMPSVLESTAAAIAEAMKGSLASSKRATIGFSTATQDSLTENRQVEGGTVDPQIGVIRVDDSDGNPISIIANFAAHPTTVDGDDKFAISADYPGAYYTALEAVAGEFCVAMFINGAEGNQRPANPQKLSGWAHTEWVGKQLAAKVMETAETISGGEAVLHVGHSTPTLPQSMASFMPTETVLKTLEINDLLLTFLPGEPCVEIGLELRRRALQRGYKAQFTVGLANDHLLYFVPRELYSLPSYECDMSFYGPGIDQWIYRECGALMTKNGGEPSLDTVKDAATGEIANGTSLTLRGSHFEMGQQQGKALRDAINSAHQTQLVQRCDDGAWIPDTGWWSFAPSFINLTPLALPRLAIGARPMLATLSNGAIDMLDGIANGAGLPFDAIWLLQCAPILSAQEPVTGAFNAFSCTMLAITGERAGSDQILVGRNLDWPDAAPAAVFDVQPESGMRYVQVGFPWTAGAYTAMNEAGLVVAVERVESIHPPSLAGPPIDMVLHDAILHDRSVADVLARLELLPHLRGYHVLIADPGHENTRVIELGESRITRVATAGVLLGSNPDAAKGDAAARYLRAANLARGETVIDSEELAAIMSDAEPGRAGLQRIRNETTRHSVVFEPRFRRMHVSFPDENGVPGKPQTFSLRKSAP
ncbi:MAG: neutral/alkaline non-lysosomal ceramidase N-terminal domain-containing protein [Candidatus Hydrogenedentes bacterium]|nr:neutral/alkaline non-lysosomal ceramidase N-terminal domain-containing protein [Candidatus Hydrogenedentota bacterium]